MIRIIKTAPVDENFPVGGIVISRWNGTKVKITKSSGKKENDFAGVVVFTKHSYEPIGHSSNTWSKSAFPFKEVDSAANSDTVIT